MTLLNVWIKITQKEYFRTKKNENRLRILHIQIYLEFKFQLQQRILIFGTNFQRKVYFPSKTQKMNITIEFFIFKLATNIRKKFVTTKFSQIFISSHPPVSPSHYNGRGSRKPCTIKLLSYLVRNNMEPYYPCTWLSFVNQKNEKNKTLKFVNEKYIYAPKVLRFKTTDLHTVYLFSEYENN